MNDPTTHPAALPADSISRYSELAAEAGVRLDAQLAAIRDDEAAGEISVIEAADERIQVMTEHRDRLKALRVQYFGE